MQNKKIGFLIYYPFQYYVHKNIYTELKKLGIQADFIIDHTGNFPIKPTDDTISKTKKLLTEENVDFVEFLFDDFTHQSNRDIFLQNYEVLVSTWYRGLIRVAKNKKTVCVQYGAGKELTTLGFWKRHFDLCLAYGDYSNDFYSQLTKSAPVGNPKFDDWFSNNFDDKLINNIKGIIDSRKKTLLYLPTHSDLCSINELAPILNSHAKQYNIIVKLHYYNLPEDPQSVSKLDRKGIIVLEDDSDLLSLLHISDVVLSDNSSAIFDTMLADKPIVVTDFHDKDYFDTGHRTRRVYRRGYGSALTYSNSVEQRIKRDGTVVTLKNSSEFKVKIEEALSGDILRESQQKKLISKLFKYKDSQSGARSAKAIVELFNSTELPEKTFLSNAIDFFEIDTIRDNIFRKQNLDSASLNNPEDVCFLISSRNSTINDISKTISSLLPSKIKNYIILTEGGQFDSDILKKNVLKINPEHKITLSKENIGLVISKEAYNYKKIIIIEAGCTIITPEYLLRVEDDFLSDDVHLSCGFVHKILATKNLCEELLRLELLISAGFTYYHKNLRSYNYFAISNPLWQNPVNESRFFMINTEMIRKKLILLDQFKDPYQILLTLKNFYCKKNMPSKFLPIQLEEQKDNSLDYFYKKTVTRTKLENLFSVKNRGVTSIQSQLLVTTLQYPFKKINLAPFALFSVVKSLQTKLMLNFYVTLRNEYLKNKNQ